MTVKDAITKVLEEADGPLHYRDICDRILGQQLWSTKGKTPCATVNANLSTNPGLFIRVDKGHYVLATRPDATQGPPETAERGLQDEAKHTYLEAAEIVLKQADAQQGLHYREITRIALARKLVQAKGLTPESTMSAQLSTDIQRRAEKGVSPRFQRVGRGVYRLAAVTGSRLAQQVDDHNRQVRSRLHSQLKKMDAGRFEEVIGLLLERLGFDNVRVTDKTNDGGIDVIGELVVADVIRTRMAVQVKRWSNNVQRPIVQQVRGSLGVHDQGLIITTGGFSAGALEEASKPNAVVVALMDGVALVEQLVEHGIGVEKTSVTIVDLSLDTLDGSTGSL